MNGWEWLIGRGNSEGVTERSSFRFSRWQRMEADMARGVVAVEGDEGGGGYGRESEEAFICVWMENSLRKFAVAASRR